MSNRVGLPDLYEKLGRLEVRHASLLSLLRGYAQPNKKIHDMIRKHELLPLTRGFYLLSPQKLKQPFQPELIANLLYGPSYVSLESALSYYGLIPEATTSVTSVTTKRPKTLETPIGTFTYEHLIRSKYALGVRQARIHPAHPSGQENRFLIASPTKALMDYLTFRMKGHVLKGPREIRTFLRDDLRLDLTRYEETEPEAALEDVKRLYTRSPNHAKVISFLRRELR